MKRSEIFDEFAKIAQEQKIISNDSKKSFRQLEKNPRADSLDISAISALYGVKPESSADMKYKNNIMEIAHPNSLVISPAYDKINGLIENEIERKNINLRIVNKNPDGLLTQRKYAQQQLMLSLVRVANDLDNKNKTQLTKLADSCLLEAKQQFSIKKEASFKKEAAWWYYVVPTVLGLIYTQQSLDHEGGSHEMTYPRLVESIDVLLNDSISWGWGTKLRPEFKNYLNSFKQILEEYNKIYKENAGIVGELRNITPEQAEELAKNKKQLEKIESAAKRLSRVSKNMFKYSKDILKKFSDPSFKEEQIIDKGFLTRIQSYIPILGSGDWYDLFSDKFGDVIRDLNPFVKSVERTIKLLEEAKEYKLQVASKLEQEKATPRSILDAEEEPSADSSAPPSTTTPASDKPSATPSTPSSGESEVEGKLEDIMRELMPK